MRIAHISDIHIRNLKYHKEYREIFEVLYAKLEDLKPDLIINTGDTAHTKTQISPEFVQMASEHIKRISEIAPYHLILGNHDLNIMNLDRQDALTPIVENLSSDRVFLHKKSGLAFSKVYNGFSKFNFWVFSLADQNNFPTSLDWSKVKDEINIGLFHGSVSSCVIDSNWRMTHTEYDISIFDGLDFAMLGDIHKRQFFTNNRIAYAGSLIQQNFGEELGKGFLLWDIDSKDMFSVAPVIVEGGKRFYTIKLNDDLSIPDVSVEEGSRIRVIPPRTITLVEQKSIERLIKKSFKPYDVITLSAKNIGSQKANVGKTSVDIENLRSVHVQERLIRDFLSEKCSNTKVLDRVVELNKKYQAHVDRNDDTARNTSWNIKKMCWSNMFNFGENNVVNFESIGGLIGVFAQNAAGKSNFVDVMMETFFDSTTRGVNKNIFLINDNKDIATSIAEVSIGDRSCMIERTIERVKFGQRKFNEAKEWGKTSVNFFVTDKDGVKVNLNGTLRPETERTIRKYLGTFDDFMLTSLSAQWNALDIIACKETKRKEILYRFLDLDSFDQKCILAKEESKSILAKLNDMEDNDLDNRVLSLKKQILVCQNQINNKLKEESDLKEDIEKINELIVEKTRMVVKIENVDGQGAAERLLKIENEISILTKNLDDKISQIEKCDELISRLSEKFQSFDCEDYSFHDAELKSLKNMLSVCDVSLSQNIQSLQTHKKNVLLLNEVPCKDSFPRCKFLINAFASKDAIIDLEKAIDEVNEEISLLLDQISVEEECVSNLKNNLDLQQKIKDANGIKDTFNLQVEVLKLKTKNLENDRNNVIEDISKYEKAKDDIKKNSDLEESISTLKSNKLLLTAKVKTLDTEIDSLTRSLGSIESSLVDVSQQLDQLNDVRESYEAFEYFISAMGKDGIAYNILTQKLPLINEEICKILSSVADFDVFIEHDNEEQTIRLYLQYGQYKSRLLELGSGAEKMIASVALRMALLNISSLPKTNVFIIDEGFGKLDSKNLESMSKMFDYLRVIFDHVIVISHLDTMKDLVDNMIEIQTDDDGYAHIEVL